MNKPTLWAIYRRWTEGAYLQSDYDYADLRELYAVVQACIDGRLSAAAERMRAQRWIDEGGDIDTPQKAKRAYDQLRRIAGELGMTVAPEAKP